MEAFIDYLGNQKGYSKHTVRNYQIDLRQFLDFLGTREELTAGEHAGLKPEAVSPLVIREYLGSLYGNLSRSSIARKPSAVRSFFLFFGKKRALQGESCG